MSYNLINCLINIINEKSYTILLQNFYKSVIFRSAGLMFTGCGVYKERHIDSQLKELAKKHKILLLIGAKGTGKKTSLSRVFPNIINLELKNKISEHYQRNPESLLDNYRSPLIINNIQYAPKLLEYIGKRAALSNSKRQFIITSTLSYELVKKYTKDIPPQDISIVEMPHMTTEEVNGRADAKNWLRLYLENPWAITERSISICKEEGIVEKLFRGNLPGALELPLNKIQRYFAQYVKSFIQEDINLLEKIRKPRTFAKFIIQASHFSGREMNYACISRHSDHISFEIVSRWLSLLEKTNQWFEIPAYVGNTTRRICSKKKGYFNDTGIACYLYDINSVESLKKSPMLEFVFNTYCVNEIISLKNFLPYELNFHHWLSSSGTKVDLILEIGGRYYPIVFQYTDTVKRTDTSGLYSFFKTYPELDIMPAMIIYLGKKCYKFNNDIMVMPWNAILEK